MSIARRLVVFCIFALATLHACFPAEAAPPSYSLTTLAEFNGTNGAEPEAGLVADSAGNLYGTTAQGGTNNLGTVFQIAAGTHALNTLFTFDGGPNGSIPIGGLVADANGNIFGAAYRGGNNSHGTIFELASGTHSFSTVATFNGANGDGPVSPLTVDSSGNIYGSTNEGGQYGYGTVYQVTAPSHVLNTIASFNFPTTGAYPSGGALVDAGGNLYGTLNYGGNYSLNNGSGAGSIFKISAPSHAITTLATFNGTNGGFPETRVVADQFGNIYGTTTTGGTSGFGTVFELPNGSSTISALVSFTGPNGSYLEGAGLYIDASGNLFGTTSLGGAYGSGTVFEVAAGTHAFSTLFSFNGTNGKNPYGTLMMDANGNLYGTTRFGGAANQGTAFELVLVPEPSSAVLAILSSSALLLFSRSRRSRIV